MSANTPPTYSRSIGIDYGANWRNWSLLPSVTFISIGAASGYYLSFAFLVFYFELSWEDQV
jgi:hypothetical protein